MVSGAEVQPSFFLSHVIKRLCDASEHFAMCVCVCVSTAGDTNDNKATVGPEDVSKMGCPSLGEHTKLEVVIEESYEFKVAQK